MSDFVKKTKLTELEIKIPDTSSLATKTILTDVENKIADVSSLVKRVEYNTKITEIEKKLTDHNHNKHITTPEFIAKTEILMLNCQVLTEKLLQIKQSTCWKWV